MSNVVQISSDSEDQPAVNRNVHNGQKKPSQFIHDPTSLLATPAYYLKTPGLAALLDHLQQTISGRGAMQVIIAEHGRGKSSLLRQLVSEAASRWMLCYIHADYHLGVEHIINGLGQVFFPQEDIDFESLVHGLATYGHREPYPVVIVDDAHNLSDYAVETLANIKHAVAEQGGDLDIILAAPPEFRRVVNGYGLSKFREEIEVHSLPRFIEEETNEYLTARFDNEEGTRFTPSQRHIIHRRACGIPAFINYHAELALGHDLSDERLKAEHKQIEKRKKKQPYYLGGGAAALLLIAVILSLLLRKEPADELTTQPSSEPPPVAMKSEPVTKIADTPPRATAKPVSKPPEPGKPEATKPVKPPVEKKPVKAAAPIIADKPKVVAKSKPASEAAVKKVATTSKPVEASKPPPAPQPAEVKTAAAAPVAGEAAEAEPAPVAPRRSDNDIPGNAWLLAQSPENYTIQLAGSPSESNIIRYIRRSSLEEELAYVYINRKNRDGLYVVLYGSFKTRDAARDIVDFFPAELRKNKPWIRPISTLQNALAK